MREIKFRGKNTINGNFVEGYYNVEKGHHYINAGHTVYPIHPWSVGQFTGLKDKNGVEIYEGDILSDTAGRLLVVEFLDNYLQLRLRLIKIAKNEYFRTYDLGSFGGCKHLEIIGNIHSNPELLNQ